MRPLSKILNLKPNIVTNFLGLTKDLPAMGTPDWINDASRTWRPPEDIYRQRGAAIQIPFLPINLLAIRDMAKHCHIFRLCIMKIGQETFRRGAEWVPVDEDDDPDTNEYAEAERFFKKVQLLFKLRRMEDDFNTFDVGYLVIRFDYVLNKEGDIVAKYPVDLVRGSPIFMRQVSDERGNLGGVYRICLVHRHTTVGPNQQTCPICGRKTYDVHYICLTTWDGTSALEYYAEGEVIKRTKYEPNLIYGQSLIVTNWRKGYTLMYMDKFGQDRFELGNQMDAAFCYPTIDQNELEKTRQFVQQKREENPHYLPWLGYDPESKNLPAFVSANREFEETQLLPLMEKYEQQISSQYGIPSIMQNDTQTSGGLNNEGNQMIMPNRTVAFAQQTYNGTMTYQGILEELTDLFLITRWKLQLKPPEEEDEMAEKQREAQEIQNVKNLVDLGATVKYENGKYLVEDAVFEQSQQPQANASGMWPEGVGAANQTSGHPGTPFGKATQKNLSKKKSLTKEHVYVSNPHEVPAGATTHRGPRGGVYYESQNVSAPTGMYSEGIAVVSTPEGKLYPGDSSADEHNDIIRRHKLPHTGEQYDQQLRGIFNNKKHQIQFEAPGKELLENDQWWNQMIHQLHWMASNGVDTKTPVTDADGKNIGTIEDLLPDKHKELLKEDEDLVKDFWVEAAKAIIDGALWGQYKDLSPLQSKTVNEILATAFIKQGKSLTTDYLINKLMNIGLDYAKAELISRTELSAVANKAREIGFMQRDPQGLFRYSWDGPNDGRTSDTCKKIQEMINQDGGAVSLQRMREIHEAAVKETMPPGWDTRFPGAPHPNCRRTLRRRMPGGR